MRLASLATLRTYLPGTRVSRLVAAAVGIHVLTAWFNGGYLHPDEHWQILEFAWHRLGHEPATVLPWEFAEQIRPAFQPWIAAGLITALQFAGVFTPFLAAFLLRLASALLGLWVSLWLCALVLPSIRRQTYRRTAFYGTLFLCTAPFLHARFSAENWGGALTFGGLALLLAADAAYGRDGRERDASLPAGIPPPAAKAVALAACAGFVWGLAFFCRLQMAPAIAGAILWWVTIRRGSWRLAGVAAAAFLIAVAANVAIDHWLYHAWLFTPLRYFDVNVLQGKASTWGTSPWWMVAAPFLLMVLPPFSVVALALLIIVVWICRRHVLVWTVVPFVAAHAAVPHKELRFMAPMIFAIAPLVALSLDNLPARLAAWLDGPRRAALRAVVGRTFVVSNAVALAIVTLIPALPTYPLLQQVWYAGRDHPVRLLVLPQSLYVHQLSDWHRMRFYQPDTVSEVKVSDGPDLLTALNAPPGTCVLVLHTGVEPPAVLTAAGIRCVTRAGSLSRTLRQLDRFGWIGDNHVWTLCEPERDR
jgi:phosphatidylinositol glycan class B